MSPGPIAAATPGAQAFTFGAGVMSSPNKALRGGVGKPHPLSLAGDQPTQQNFGIYHSMFAALPSPQFGTFLFPPTTPTGLIAPISLPGGLHLLRLSYVLLGCVDVLGWLPFSLSPSDLTAPTDSAPSTSSTTTGIPTPSGSNGQVDAIEAPPTKKSKPDGSPNMQ